MVEACADLAGVAQTLVLLVAHQQRAEVRARPLRRGEAADHELLLEVALELEPVARAGGRAVRAVCALRDQPFEALAAGLAEQLRAVLVAVRAVAHPPAELEGLAQERLALAQWQVANVAAIVAQQVEHVQEDCHLLPRAPLQPREAGDAVLEGDELAVRDEVVHRLGLERLRHLAELARHVLVGAGDQADRAAAVAVGHAADAVELALEDPVRVVEGLVREDGLHWRVGAQLFLDSTARSSCCLSIRERPSMFRFLASL